MQNERFRKKMERDKGLVDLKEEIKKLYQDVSISAGFIYLL